MAEGPDDAASRHSRLVKSSKELIQQSREHLETAKRGLVDARLRMHRARNVLQLAVFWRKQREKRQ
jgi:hypothetical protein